jgi:hypothetical protein
LVAALWFPPASAAGAKLPPAALTEPVDTIRGMDDEAPTLARIVPEGTRLGWSDFSYSMVGFLGEVVMVNSTPTEDIGSGAGITFVARFLRVATVERQGDEWAFLLIFAGGPRVSIPEPGFRGALLDGDGDLTVVSDTTTVTIRTV